MKLIDADPIGINVCSTVATYANVHDELRKVYAKLPDAKEAGYKAGDFSYNTGKLRCPTCDGTGVISLDVQFYRMWRYLVRIVMEADIMEMQGISKGKQNPVNYILCQN